MWSIYDTFMLLAGIITAAIAVIPIPTIPAKTRAVSGAIGGGLILLSLFLGSLMSFTYPALVFAAPVIALIAGGVVVRSALDTQKQRDAVAAGADHGPLQYGQAGHTVTPPAAVPVAPSASAPAPDPRTSAWEALFAQETPADRLAEIAASFPEFAAQIAAHPNCYPALRSWASATDPRQGGTA